MGIGKGKGKRQAKGTRHPSYGGKGKLVPQTPNVPKTKPKSKLVHAILPPACRMLSRLLIYT